MILWKTTYRHYFKHPWQILISILGVSLGVSVVVAIDLSNNSARTAFELSSNTITGKATHQIVGGASGVPEDVYRNLRIELKQRNIAPVVEGYGRIIDKNKESFSAYHIVGIDPFAEKPLRSNLQFTNESFEINRLLTETNAIVLLESTARKLGIPIDGKLSLQVNGIDYIFSVVGLIEPTEEVQELALDNVLYMDIAAAQEILGMQGFLSYIDIKIDDSSERTAIKRSITKDLPPNVKLISAQTKNYALNKMTEAFRLNLSALSLLALIVGVFLIYNTMTFAVVSRREMIGHLRTLGVSRNQIFILIFSEAMLIGGLATVIGLQLGIWLASGLTDLVTRTINDLYFVLHVNKLTISYSILLKGLIVGITATLIAGFIPAFEATRSSPRSSTSRSNLESKFQKAVSWASWVGIAFWLIGIAIFVIPSSNVILSYIGLFIMIMGFAFLVPLMTLALTKGLTPLMRVLFGALGNMSARSITTSMSRTSVAIAALSMAIAATIGVAIMIDSFRSSVVNWLDNSLRADVYVTPAGIDSGSRAGSLSQTWIDEIRSYSEVQQISVNRKVRLQHAEGETLVHVIDIPEDSFSRFQIIEGSPGSAQIKFFYSEAVLISEPYAFRHNVRVGDSLWLPTDAGSERFKVAGIYVDYGSEQGIIAMHRKTYNKYWKDDSITEIGIYLKEGVNIEEFVSALRSTVENRKRVADEEKVQNLNIRSHKRLKEASLKIFDRTFVVTQVLRFLAVIVAFVGIMSALMAIQLERSRELALLKTIGLTPRQVWLVVNGETGLIGTLAGIIAVPLGFLLSLVLIYVINKRSFGWTMEIDVDPMMLLQSVGLSLGAAIIAGIYPAFKMSHSPTARPLREE